MLPELCARNSLLASWKFDPQFRSCTYTARDFDVSAVRPYKHSRYGEAQTQFWPAIGRPGDAIEWLKDVIQLGLGNTASGVGHPDERLTPVRLHAEGNASPLGRRCKGVCDEILHSRSDPLMIREDDMRSPTDFQDNGQPVDIF